jgi:hypothetical protein
MKISDQLFSAEVELPCRLFSESGTELSGIVTSIDTGSLVLELQAAPKDLGVEDRVRLEMALPVGPRQIGSKYLNVRARLVNMEKNGRGLWSLRFKLWKTRFSDRMERKPVKAVKAQPSGVRM